MKISYVLPVWNVDHILALTLRSLIKQTHTDKEIIVIDDGSNDHTLEICNHFYNDINLLITNSERKGAAYSRNVGKEAASGDIIAVCDADSYTKNRGEILDKFFTDTDNDVFHSSIKVVNATDPSQEWVQEALKWDFKSKCPISFPTVAFRSEVAKNCNHPEKTMETCLYEFFLFEAHDKGYKFGGAQDITCIKLEETTGRDRKKAWEFKKEMYLERGIEI